MNRQGLLAPGQARAAAGAASGNPGAGAVPAPAMHGSADKTVAGRAPLPSLGDLYLHRKTNGVYMVFGLVCMQTSAAPDLDDQPAVLYRLAQDAYAPMWVRPLTEFTDGRFDRVEGWPCGQ